MIDVYLASRSPRRAALLDQIRVRYQVLEVDVDETWNGKEPPQAFVTRLALEKALALGDGNPDEIRARLESLGVK